MLLIYLLLQTKGQESHTTISYRMHDQTTRPSLKRSSL